MPSGIGKLFNSSESFIAEFTNSWLDVNARPYSREQAAYPDTRLRRAKFWPTSSRIDDSVSLQSFRGFQLNSIADHFLHMFSIVWRSKLSVRVWYGRGLLEVLRSTWTVFHQLSIFWFFGFSSASFSWL